MGITASEVKELREKTGAGMMDCKKVLTEANGDMEKAIELLREKGLAAAVKKSSRIAAEGVVDSYIHMGGKIGVLLEVNCETDFVAKTDDFKALVKDIAMQIAAANPKYLRKEDVDTAELEKERERFSVCRRSTRASRRRSSIRWLRAEFRNTSRKSACLSSRLLRIRINPFRILSPRRSPKSARTFRFAALSAMRWARASKRDRIISWKKLWLRRETNNKTKKRTRLRVLFFYRRKIADEGKIQKSHSENQRRGTL